MYIYKLSFANSAMTAVHEVSGERTNQRRGKAATISRLSRRLPYIRSIDLTCLFLDRNQRLSVMRFIKVFLFYIYIYIYIRYRV